jgi:hypothetical protein
MLAAVLSWLLRTPLRSVVLKLGWKVALAWPSLLLAEKYIGSLK